MKIFAGLSISSPQPLCWLSVNWTNILAAVTSCNENSQHEREVQCSRCLDLTFHRPIWKGNRGLSQAFYFALKFAQRRLLRRSDLVPRSHLAPLVFSLAPSLGNSLPLLVLCVLLIIKHKPSHPTWHSTVVDVFARNVTMMNRLIQRENRHDECEQYSCTDPRSA